MKTMIAKFDGTCAECRRPISKGAEIEYEPEGKFAFHPACSPDPYNGKTGTFVITVDDGK